MEETQRTIKVLYVEDDPIDQKGFVRFIKKANLPIEAELASSVDEGRFLIKEKKYDVVITDYLLNNETGFAIIDAVKNAPVIFLTGQGDQQIAVRAMKKGAYDYIVKESSGNYLDQLIIAIEKAFAYNLTNVKLKEAEQEIKKLLWALSQINNAITIFTRDGSIEWVNKGFENLFGYMLDEIKGKKVTDFRKGNVSDGKIIELIEHAFEHSTTATCESKIVSKNGIPFWIYTTITPVTDELGNVEKAIIVDTDISEKKKIEEELITAKEKAEAAAISKQQFLANMSHEIRTPINAIMGIMHMLETTDQAETRRRYIQLVNTASNNLLNIINDILDMSKLEVGKMTLEKTDFNVHELALNLKRSMQYRAEEKGLQIQCHIDREVPMRLYGDPVRLNQILMNLVGNAIKFTQQGGVTISLKTAAHEDHKVKLLFTVSDTGIGIPKSAQKHIFEYFHQVHGDATRNYGGTGLGLAIVKRLTAIQKGKVWFKSEEGKGTEFYVELEFEISKDQHREAPRQVTLDDGQFLKGKKILLVEDEALNQMVARHLLEKELGATVEIAANGKIATNKAKDSSYDLIIMDIQMPEMNGYDATRYIRTQLPSPKNETPVLAMTAHAFKDEEIKCKEAGMNAFVSKPIKIDDLKQKLHSIFDGNGHQK
jgi:PAS domain S-box-containing protein